MKGWRTVKVAVKRRRWKRRDGSHCATALRRGPEHLILTLL
jgi:hypothetical protein